MELIYIMYLYTIKRGEVRMRDNIKGGEALPLRVATR